MVEAVEVTAVTKEENEEALESNDDSELDTVDSELDPTDENDDPVDEARLDDSVDDAAELSELLSVGVEELVRPDVPLVPEVPVPLVWPLVPLDEGLPLLVLAPVDAPLVPDVDDDGLDEVPAVPVPPELVSTDVVPVDRPADDAGWLDAVVWPEAFDAWVLEPSGPVELVPPSTPPSPEVDPPPLEHPARASAAAAAATTGE